MELKFISIHSEVFPYDHTALCIFEHTSLQPDSFISTLVLDTHFKYGKVNAPLTISCWDSGKDGQYLDTKFTLNQLLNDCAEIREYARKYFPEYAI